MRLGTNSVTFGRQGDTFVRDSTRGGDPKKTFRVVILQPKYFPWVLIKPLGRPGARGHREHVSHCAKLKNRLQFKVFS